MWQYKKSIVWSTRMPDYTLTWLEKYDRIDLILCHGNFGSIISSITQLNSITRHLFVSSKKTRHNFFYLYLKIK